MHHPIEKLLARCQAKLATCSRAGTMLDYVIDHEQRIVRLTGTGRLTVAEVLADQSRLRADPGSNPDYALLADYRAADLSQLDAAKMRVIAARSPLASTSLRAFVVRGEANFGLGRMFQALNAVSERAATVRVFHDIDKAIAWLLAPRTSAS